MTTTDPDFGLIQYVEPTDVCLHGYWQKEEGWTVAYQKEPVSSAEIPGTEVGPSDEARRFILSKRDEPENLWRIAEPSILALMSDWSGFEGKSPRDTFFISNIAMDSEKTNPQGWEVCFQTKEDLKWIYFCLQIKGDKVITNTIDT